VKVAHEWPPSFGVAKDHCRDVLDGSYDIPFDPDTPPTILDVGANVGAFALWAEARWPGSTIYGFEPHPGTYKLLLRTIGDKIVRTYRVGVSDHDGHAIIKSGPNNCGEASIVMPHTGTKEFRIELMDAKRLPEAQILKMDTEGCEALILKRLIECGRLPKFSAVMMETHGPADQAWIESEMGKAGFTVTKKNQWHPNRCELCWVRSDLLPKDFKKAGAKKVLIATPLLGNVSAHYLGRIMTLLKADWGGRYEFQIQVKTGGSVATARNMAADFALKGGFDKIFWLDKDVGDQDMNRFLMFVNHMLGRDVDWVSATYAAHIKGTHFHGAEMKGAKPDSRGLKRMFQMPMGFSVMDVSVLKRIKEKFPLREYTVFESGGVSEKYFRFFHEDIIGPNTAEGKLERIRMIDTQSPEQYAQLVHKILTDPDTSGNRFLGEDYAFCSLCFDAGIEMWMETTFIVPHEETLCIPIPTEQLAGWMAEEWRQPPKPKKRGWRDILKGKK
jgi:FkbM family methyltransferase